MLCHSKTALEKVSGCHLNCNIHTVIFAPFEVNVILRLTHLPPFPEYTIDLGRFPRAYGPVRPVTMEGLVIAMTRVTKYTQGARFLCQNDGCPCSAGTYFVTSLPYFVKCFTLNAVVLSLGECKHFFFVCLPEHFCYLGFHHIRVHRPGATESATVGNNLNCMMCSSPLKEDVKFRVLGGEMDVYMSDKMHCSVI